MERVQSERRFIQRRCRESKSVGVLAVGNIRRTWMLVRRAYAFSVAIFCASALGTERV